MTADDTCKRILSMLSSHLYMCVKRYHLRCIRHYHCFSISYYPMRDMILTKRIIQVFDIYLKILKMEESLIENVRQHDILYNVSSANYRDKHMREEAWQEIGKELNMRADKAKELWERLRRCFINALNRRRLKKNNQSGQKLSPWKYEPQMSFILPFVETRKIQGNVEDNQKHMTDQDEDLGDEARDDTEIDKDIKMEYDTEEQNEARMQNAFRTSSNSSQQIVQILKENVSFRNQTNEKKQERSSLYELDESDMFYLSMSRMAKRLPIVEQTKLKLGLSEAVLRAELCFAQRENHVVTSQTSDINSPEAAVSQSPTDSERLFSTGNAYDS